MKAKMPLLEAKNLSFFRTSQVIDNVSLQVYPGQIVGILGSNGAGKTTTFQIIMGLLKPSSGQVVMDDQEMTHANMTQRASMGLAYLPQEASIFRRLTVYENIVCVLELQDLTSAQIKDKTQAIMSFFNLHSIASRQGQDLSGGQRRRVEVARAVAMQPKVLLVDEPFSAVDPLAIQEAKETLKRLAKSNIAMLVTDHNVRDVLQISDHVYVMHQGKIIAHGAPAELKNNTQVKDCYFGDAVL